MQSSTAFQIVSIEPTQTLEDVVIQAAQRHKLSANFDDSRVFNAPVCGIEYHIQEIELTGGDNSGDVRGAMLNCIKEIESIADQSLADGYLELL